MNQLTQCTGWMHCFVGGCVTTHFTLPFRLNIAMFNDDVSLQEDGAAACAVNV